MCLCLWMRDLKMNLNIKSKAVIAGRSWVLWCHGSSHCSVSPKKRQQTADGALWVLLWPMNLNSLSPWLCKSTWGEQTIMWPEGEINASPSFGTIWISLFQQRLTDAFGLLRPRSLFTLVLNLSDHQCWWWVKWECKPVYIQGPHISFLSTILLKKHRRPKMKQRNDSRSSACSMSSPVDAVILLQWAG